MSEQKKNENDPDESLRLSDAVILGKREDDSEKPYYSLTNATADLIDSKGAGEIAASTAKLAAKSIFNLGRFVITAGPKLVSETAERERNKSK